MGTGDRVDGPTILYSSWAAERWPHMFRDSGVMLNNGRFWRNGMAQEVWWHRGVGEKPPLISKVQALDEHPRVP
jgi:hypothetical protein